VLHLGGVRFPITGPVRYSMTGQDALHLLDALDPRIAVPVHYDGWSHFHEPHHRLREVLGAASPQNRTRITWLTPGEATQLG
jgi:L-ascorbate metabolism protein UlaG (beta-lactamase superfamily)